MVIAPNNTMDKTSVSKMVAHNFNGNEVDETKFVEVEGKKFVDDGTGKPKLDDKQQPIPFTEKKADDNLEDLSAAELEDLAKRNPKVAKMLTDKAEADKKLADIAKADEDRKRKDAETNGEWQKLAEEEKTKREKAEAELATKSEQLGKYVGSVEKILKGILATIPKERQLLIPADYSARQKLEYITANAKLLGANVNAAGGGIPPSDENPSGTDESKLVGEIEELIKKGGTRTASENTLLFEKGKALKQLRAKKAQEGK